MDADGKNWDLKLINFETHVKSLARNRDGEIFFNSGPEKAKVVIQTLFKVAQKRLDIYSGALDKEIYSKELFQSLLDEKGISADQIRVILTKPDNADQELLSYLTEKNIEVREYPETGGHLIVADGDCYRFEHNHESKKAYFAFGAVDTDESIIKKLKHAFNEMWRHGTAVPAGNTGAPTLSAEA